MIPADDWEVRALAERWWHRNPLGFLEACVVAKEYGTTLLALVRWRLEQLKREREATRG